MKIAISSTGKELEDNIDSRFGRCPYFIIVEVKDKEMKNGEAIENIASSQTGGAGMSAAQLVADHKIDAVITPNIGPRAFDVFKQLGIKIYKAQGKIIDAVNSFTDGKLEEIKDSTGPQHMGMNDSSKINNSEKIFIPLLDNKGEDSNISEHFGHAPFFAVYDTKKSELTIKENVLDHANPSLSPVDQIVEEADPTIVFAKGIGGRAIELFHKKGIKLKTGDFKIVKDIIENIEELKDLKEGCGN